MKNKKSRIKINNRNNSYCVSSNNSTKRYRVVVNR